MTQTRATRRVDLRSQIQISPAALQARSAMSDKPPLEILSCPDGLKLVRQLLRPILPYDCHDHQLEGVCKAVDGVDLLAVIPTGGGKTGYFFMYILLLLEIQKRPAIAASLKKKHPSNPALVLVSPTNGLEVEMVSP